MALSNDYSGNPTASIDPNFDMGTLPKEGRKPWRVFKTKAEQQKHTYYGDQAIRMVEKREGRKMTHAERRVIEEEAFVDGLYKDTAVPPVVTAGVGQTGKYQDMSFDETFKIHEDRAAAWFPKQWESFPDDLKAELIVMEYRGDLGFSRKTRGFIKAGKWKEASIELLDNKDYRTSMEGNGAIAARLQRGSDMLAKHGRRVAL